MSTGALLVLLGLWGGLAPFIGPYLGYGYTPNTPWIYTMGRLWLVILPAAAVVLGGLLLVGAANRFTGAWGSWLAAIGGAWFVVGGTFSRLWNGGIDQAGAPTGDVVSQVVQAIGLFLGLGVVVVFLAAVAMTRFGVEPGHRAPAAGTPVETYPQEPAPGAGRHDEDVTAAESRRGRFGLRRGARHEHETGTTRTTQ